MVAILPDRMTENVEAVRSFYPGPDVDVKALVGSDEAAARWIDAMAPRVDPSFQGTIRLPGLAPVTFLGLDGLLDIWRRWHTKWASFRLESVEMIDAGEYVVAVDRGHGRHETDGPEETLRRTVLWTVREGRVVRADFNVPHAEALAMAGLTR